jgi:hypothetical protein
MMILRLTTKLNSNLIEHIDYKGSFRNTTVKGQITGMELNLDKVALKRLAKVDRRNSVSSRSSTGYGLAAQRLPCQLQLLAEPDRFRIEGAPLERG